jgi:hypothetical protein
MRSQLLLIGTVGLVLALTACTTPAPNAAETSASTPAAAPTEATSTPPAAPEPATPSRLVISLDALKVEFADHEEAIDYRDAEGAVALLDSIAGPAAITDIPQKSITNYEWPGVFLTSNPAGQFSITVSVESLGAVRIETPEGIGVGSSRDAAVGAGAVDGYDADGDGLADYLELGGRDVPGTTSLADPDVVGQEYLEFRLNGDVVDYVRAPANDWSDV